MNLLQVMRLKKRVRATKKRTPTRKCGIKIENEPLEKKVEEDKATKTRKD